MTMQNGWRWCSKCQVLFYGASGTSVCPAGGAHDGSKSSRFLVPTDEPAIGQQGWLWCRTCQGLFYGTGDTRCPGGGMHDGSSSSPHSLLLDSQGGSAQAGWCWCKKCQSLFYGTGPSTCPAGDAHDGSDSSAFFLAIESASVPAPAKRPASKDLVWIIWYDNTDQHRLEHDIAINGVVRNLTSALGATSTAKVWLYETADTASAQPAPQPPVVDFDAFDTHPDKDRLLALVLLGSFPWWESYSEADNETLAKLETVLRTTDIPILAFCGGHQLVAKAFAAGGPEPVGHIFASDNKRDAIGFFGSDSDFAATYPDGKDGQTYLPRESNYNDEDGCSVAVTLTEAGQADPIYAYLGPQGSRRPGSFMFWHHDEIKTRHPDFALLASTSLSTNQSLKHKTKLIYTTQFHPEQSASPLDGDGLVQTFFRMAAQRWLDQGAS